MNTYTNVLVEIVDKDLPIKMPLRVFFEGDGTNLAGIVTDHKVTEEGLFVDIQSTHNLSGYTPSVLLKSIVVENGRVIEGKILGISIFKDNLNIDERVTAIA